VAALLLDENMPRSVGVHPAAQGHEVHFVADMEPGAPDARVLALSREIAEVLVTLDADFGDLVFQHGHLPPRAIVLRRLQPMHTTVAAALVADALSGDPSGMFVVCTPDGQRRRPMPQPIHGSG
jgi:predicted nuclease of predicted toxin-antitoxin system